ncbi:MAG: FTR1 family protein, partial [Gammaproteobacteria bacterium]
VERDRSVAQTPAGGGVRGKQAEFSEHLLTAIAGLPAHMGRDALMEQARLLARQIRARADGALVAHTAREAARQIVRIYEVRLTPRAVPDLALGAELFHDKCTGCHGAAGYGDGPAAARLDPPPINFHDRARAMERSVYGLYSAISLGVEGTEMRAFRDLSDGQRWALAFYVSNFVFGDEERHLGEAAWRHQPLALLKGIDGLTSKTPAELATLAGGRGLAQMAYLRSHPEAVIKNVHPLDSTVERLGASIASYRSGNLEQAYREALSAYLDGFELAEPALRLTNPGALKMLEGQMMAYRQLIKRKAPLAEAESGYQALVRALDEVRSSDSGSQISAEADAASAAVILLREGLEAILILAAIAGVLIKTGRRDALPYLHAGWVSALLLGGVTWAVSTYFFTIGGSNRELTEGVTALLATAVLVYVGFWLHGKSNARRWREFVDSKIKGALQGRALWALTAVAFLAVYREVFETVLFYQALWMQAGPGQHIALWSGIGVGLGILLLLGWLILRFSMRLPLRLFFNINSIILFVLALAFSGHGIAALQEVGLLSVTPIPLPKVEVLGIYPTVETVLVQAIIAVLIIAIMMRERFSSRGAEPATA